MSNPYYFAIEESLTQYDRGKTTYTIVMHKGRRSDGRKFQIARDEYGKYSTGKDKEVPPQVVPHLIGAVEEFIAALHRD